MLLLFADALPEVDRRLAARLTPEVVGEIAGLIPSSWLVDPGFADAEAHRAAYAAYLLRRLEAPRAFVEEAVDARAQLV